MPPFLPTRPILAERQPKLGASGLDDVYRDVWTGGFPGLIAGPIHDRELFYSSYLQTYPHGLDADGRGHGRVPGRQCTGAESCRVETDPKPGARGAGDPLQRNGTLYPVEIKKSASPRRFWLPTFTALRRLLHVIS